MLDVILIGAGQAGLAAGYQARKQGLRFQILEASQDTAGSWPHYYENLRVFSPVTYSNLPGMPFPGEGGHYPTRQEVIDYLRAYARQYNLPIQRGQRVTAVTPQPHGYDIETAQGSRFQARAVIVATGAFNQPHMPQFAGESSFAGRRLHTFDYDNPSRFAGERVLVIGGGNSAVQVAADLVGTAVDVTLASRQPLRFKKQTFLGKDFHFWSRWTGFDKRRPRPSTTHYVMDSGGYQALIEAGKIRTREMFDRFWEGGVVWPDGEQAAFDSVIYGTGYQPSYPFLPAAALNGEGELQQRNGISHTLPGLYFVGQAYQRNFASATLRGVGSDAAVVVDHLLVHVLRRSAWGVRLKRPLVSAYSLYCQQFCDFSVVRS